MSNYQAGHDAETVAADYLQAKGYRVVAQNWRTRWCEIDLVVLKNRVVYFVEVKFRRNGWQGQGLDYVTPKKLQRMRFAAEMWVHAHGWQGEYTLAALGVDGGSISFVEQIDA
jgi:uncharacterized protein (TIGR00252 family)